MQINIYEAKTQLSQLVDAAHNGETVIIAKAGTPMAKLVPLSHGPKRRVKYGLMKGQFVEPADFDAPLPEDILSAFEGGPAS
jgi:prevent-host-death family protein